jgi:hypothetical protein
MSVLAPQDRTPLLDALRPPSDFTLHTAIGTTFSLDLVAFLSASVGFTFFELDESGESMGDHTPLALLEAIRRHASQMLVFCEAGRIAVPPKHRQLFSYLEDRIVQARAPADNRSFHPKLWIIRYVASDERVKYRLLCMSRNLTFDKCLDTVVVLDGDLREDRSNGFTQNGPLKEFVNALPGMAIGDLAQSQAQQCAAVGDEIGKVEWNLEGLPAEDLVFWPLGHQTRKAWPFRDATDRVLVMSPFLSDGVVERLSKPRAEHVLISRRHALDRLTQEARAGFAAIHVIRDQPEVDECPEGPVASPDASAANDLHAKVYIADRGWEASLWTGSANATHAAFDGNVEFLVELRGKKSLIGIDAFLKGPEGTVCMRELLEPYTPPDTFEPDAELEALEDSLEKVRRQIATLPWWVSVEAQASGEAYRVQAHASGAIPMCEPGVMVLVRPLALGPEVAQPLAASENPSVAFENVSLEGLTSFLVIEAHGRAGSRALSVSFIVNARLIGEPPNRRERLLQSMLKNKRDVVRYLLLLLADLGDEAGLGAMNDCGGVTNSRSTDSDGEALLEPLLRTFARAPDRLPAVAQLVRDLGVSPETASLVPEGLAQLVESLMAAREEATS